DAALAVDHLLSFADTDARPARSRLLRTVRLHRAGAGLRGYDHGRHERRDRDEADVPDGRVRAGEDLAHRGCDRTLRAVVRLRARWTRRRPGDGDWAIRLRVRRGDEAGARALAAVAVLVGERARRSRRRRLGLED